MTVAFVFFVNKFKLLLTSMYLHDTENIGAPDEDGAKSVEYVRIVCKGKRMDIWEGSCTRLPLDASRTE
jgi:hypothetical protein